MGCEFSFTCNTCGKRCTIKNEGRGTTLTISRFDGRCVECYEKESKTQDLPREMHE